MAKVFAPLGIALIVGGMLVLPPPAVATPATAVRDDTAASTRTIPAYKDVDDPGRTVRMFTVSFRARAGEKRYITSKVLARQPSSTPDVLLMASVSIACYPTGRPKSGAGATQNTLRGRTTTLTPRLVYTAPSDATVNCHLSATGRRPRPVSSGPTTDNVWYVDPGSFLSASVPMPSWTRMAVSGATSRVLDPGEQWSPIVLWMTVGSDVTSFEVVSDHKVTTCTSVGGSRDSTTGGRQLCEGRVDPSGTRVELTVKARQRTSTGTWCSDSKIVKQYTTFVSKNVHHKMLFAKGKVNVNPACGSSRFVITGAIRVISGSDLMIHAPSERTLALV